MKKLILILIVASLFACKKNIQKGYLIENWGGVELTLVTPEQVYVIPAKSQLNIKSSGSYENFTYIYEGLKARVDTKNEHPTRTIMVVPYLYKFSLIIAGKADSASIIFNKKHSKVKLPYSYGSDDITSYDIEIKPIRGQAVSEIKINDRLEKRFYHRENEIWKVSGNVN